MTYFNIRKAVVNSVGSSVGSSVGDISEQKVDVWLLRYFRQLIINNNEN